MPTALLSWLLISRRYFWNPNISAFFIGFSGRRQAGFYCTEPYRSKIKDWRAAAYSICPRKSRNVYNSQSAETWYRKVEYTGIRVRKSGIVISVYNLHFIALAPSKNWYYIYMSSPVERLERGDTKLLARLIRIS